MTALGRLVQLALAALLAAGGGGLILAPLLVLLSLLLTGPPGATALSDLLLILLLTLVFAAITAVQGIATAALPAFLAGSVLWAAGRSRPWARRRLAWAAAGTAVALFCWLWLFVLPGERPLARLGPSQAVLAALLVAGALGGQLFRPAMTMTAPFLGFDEEEEPCI